MFFRGLQGPQGLAAIITNPGPESRVRVSFRGAGGDIEEVLTARRFHPAASGNMSAIEVLVPASGVSFLLARNRR